MRRLLKPKRKPKRCQGRRGHHLGDKFRACQSGAKSEEESHNRGESRLWLASSYLEHEVSIQEGVKKFHLCLSVLSKIKARSPDKFMDVTSDVKMIDENDFCPLV